MPLITDADGVWIMTVQWDCLGGVRPVRIERLKVRVDDNVDLVDTPRESATQEQPPPERPRFGQKRFPAEAIEPQDRIFWSKSGADLMMTVDTASHTMHNGVRCRRFTGMTYALNSGGVGDPITGARVAKPGGQFQRTRWF